MEVERVLAVSIFISKINDRSVYNRAFAVVKKLDSPGTISKA